MQQSVNINIAFGIVTGEQLAAFRTRLPAALEGLPFGLVAVVVEGRLLEQCFASDVLRDLIRANEGIARTEPAWRLIEMMAAEIIAPTIARLRGGPVAS